MLFDGTAKVFYSFYKPVRKGEGNGRTADGFRKLEGTVVGAAAAPTPRGQKQKAGE